MIKTSTSNQMQKLFLSLQKDFLMHFLYCSLTFYQVKREENPIYWCNLNVIVGSERNSFNLKCSPLFSGYILSI